MGACSHAAPGSMKLLTEAVNFVQDGDLDIGDGADQDLDVGQAGDGADDTADGVVASDGLDGRGGHGRADGEGGKRVLEELHYDCLGINTLIRRVSGLCVMYEACIKE